MLPGDTVAMYLSQTIPALVPLVVLASVISQRRQWQADKWQLIPCDFNTLPSDRWHQNQRHLIFPEAFKIIEVLQGCAQSCLSDTCQSPVLCHNLLNFGSPTCSLSQFIELRLPYELICCCGKALNFAFTACLGETVSR